MLTQVVGSRVYDFSYAAGRRDLAMVIGVAVSTDDTVYLLTRSSEIIPDAPWDRTGSPAKIGKYTIGPEWGTEELIKEFGKYGQGDGQFIWPTGIALDSSSKRLRHRRVAEPGRGARRRRQPPGPLGRGGRRPGRAEPPVGNRL